MRSKTIAIGSKVIEKSQRNCLTVPSQCNSIQVMKDKCNTCLKEVECEPYPFDFVGMLPVCESCRDAHDEERAEEELEREQEDRDEDYDEDYYYQD